MNPPAFNNSWAIGREFKFSEQDFETISRIIHEDSGIRLSPSKKQLVYSRLVKRLRALKIDDTSKYCRMIAKPEGAEERSELLSALTTNVTRFFREPHHFDDLQELLRSGLAARARAGERLRFWSTACSTGEEPFSIATTVLASIPEAARLDVKVLATDIDPHVLKQAQTAIYEAPALDGVQSELRSNFFHENGERWQVNDQVRRLVTYRKLNLTEPFPMPGQFDAIFCRNVAIYFDRQTQESLWMRFADKLTPAGRLYLGHSERVSGPALDRLISTGVTSYSISDHGE